MIARTPFDIPFMAEDSLIPGTDVYVFDFGGNFVLHQSSGQYLEEDFAALSNFGLYGLNSSGGNATPPVGVHEVGPLTESNRTFSFSFGQYLRVLNFASASSVSGSAIVIAPGLYDLQPNPLGRDASGQVIGSIDSGTLNAYSQSHDLGGNDIEFRPQTLTTLGSVGGSYFPVFFYASGRDSAGTFSFSAGGSYIPQEGADARNSGCISYEASGLYQSSIDALGRENRGATETFSAGGDYALGALTSFSRISASTTVTASGRYTSGERETDLNVTRITEDGQTRFVE